MPLFLNKKIVQMSAIRSSAVVASLWLQIWLVGEFGAANYGNFVFFLTLCSLVTIVSKGGLDTLALKAAAIALNSGSGVSVVSSIRSRYLWRGVLFTSASCLALWLIYVFLSEVHTGFPALNWGLIYAASVGVVLFQILVAIARGLDRPAIADAFDAIVRNGLMALVALTLVASSFVSANAVIAAYVLSFYLASLLLYRLTNVEPRRRAGGGVERIQQDYGFKAHFGFMIAGLLSFVFFQMDTLILGFYVDSVELGSYNMACNLVRAVIFIPMILIVLVQPRIAVAFENADMRSVTKIAMAGAGASFISAVLCCALLWLLGEFILVWINPVFVAAKNAMLILSIAHIVNSILIIVGGVLSMTSKYMDVARAQLVGSIVALALYLWLIPRYGQVGGALAMFAGLMVVMVCYLVIYRRYLPKMYGFLLSETK